MAPSITAYIQQISAQDPQFKTLTGVRPIERDGAPLVVRTSLFAEALVTIEEERYLLCLPLSGMADSKVVRTCAKIKQINSNALTEYRLLPAEISLPDSLGREVECDLILHRLPAGESLDQAVTHIATVRIRSALNLLKQEMLKAGFLHGNLKPSNLIYGDDERIYPIRYHYAQLKADAAEIEAEFSRIESFVAEHPEVKELEEHTPPTEYLSQLPYDEVFQLHNMMRRVRRGELYGYLDSNDNEVITPQFTYAEEFFEDRAVVQTAGSKMGVIDKEGRWIVQPIYDMIGLEDGIFDARIGDKWIKIDYLGTTINNQ